MLAFYLIDLQLGEEGVEAVDLLPLLDKGVVLGDALQGQLVHQVDLVGLLEVLPHEALDGEGEGGAVEEDLAALGQEADHLVQHSLEVLAQQLVSLVQHQHSAVAHIGNLETETIRIQQWRNS